MKNIYYKLTRLVVVADMGLIMSDLMLCGGHE
jgi:hypothetical protein